MPDQEYLKQLRIPTRENPLRVLVSACFVGVKCGVDGDDYGDYESVMKLKKYDNVRFIPFCPEYFVLGTPRETPDCIGGTGHDVIEGNARVTTQTGKDITSEMIIASKKMLEIAQDNDVELALLMDSSGACGSQVIYNGSRFSENPKYQIGMGVCAAQLDKHGIKVVSQRDFASLELLYAKLDPNHVIKLDAKDHNQHEWYLEYFKTTEDNSVS